MCSVTWVSCCIWGYHVYDGGCSVLWGRSFVIRVPHSTRYSWYPSHVSWYLLTLLKLQRMVSPQWYWTPHRTHDILPLASRYPWVSPMVLKITPTVLMISLTFIMISPMVLNTRYTGWKSHTFFHKSIVFRWNSSTRVCCKVCPQFLLPWLLEKLLLNCCTYKKITKNILLDCFVVRFVHPFSGKNKLSKWPKKLGKSDKHAHNFASFCQATGQTWYHTTDITYPPLLFMTETTR